MFLQHPFPLTLFFLCSFQRRLWKMMWYKQGITFLSHCSFPICSVLTAQPIIKAITRIQFCLLHSTQQSQVLLLTEMEVERDEQQGRSFPDCISFSKARRGYGDNVSFHALLCIPLQWVGQISIAHCAKPQGQERKERVMALLSFPWSHAQGMQQPRAQLLEAVWLLMLPLKFSNFTLSSS